MNITPQSYNLPIQTAVNPQTDSLRRDNQQREIIIKPEASHHSAAEKGVASDKERGRSPAQNNEQVDFTSLRKQAEQANEVIGNGGGNEGSEQHAQENDAQHHEHQSKGTSDAAEHEEESTEQIRAEKEIIRDLASRDKEVRTHEMAHATVGGAYTGSPSYTFEIGPDGKKYAVDGEVSVDLSTVAGNPQATISKMQRVYAAALAPAQPSAQDLRVANSATKKIMQAQSELAGLNSDTRTSNTERKSTLSGVESEQDDVLHNHESNEFDHAMEQTLKAQEAVVPTRSSDIDQRALRIENFYSNINRAYEKQPSYQFELTA